MGVRLPAEYQEVEYIQVTGTQAFFTDIPIQDGLTVDSVQTFDCGDTYLFGGNNGHVQICFNGTYNGRLQSAYDGFYYWTGGFDVKDNNTTKYHVVQTQSNGSQIGFVDDVQILNGTRRTTKDTSAGKTAALFGQRNASGVLSTFYKGKLYSCKVSKDDTLLADFVPCYRKADGEIGMYDLVLQKFYVNDGTGVFLKGNDVIDSISPLMVAWRRALMKAPLLDTSPKIAEYGKACNLANTGERDVSNLCITDWYQFDPKQNGVITIFYYIKSGLPKTDGNYQYWCLSSVNSDIRHDWYYNQSSTDYTRRIGYSSPYSVQEIRFTIVTADIKDVYAYVVETGQIFFAGKNTPYYGYTNINDMPQG